MVYYANPGADASFDPAPAGLQRAVCCDFVYLGVRPRGQYEPQKSFEYWWQLEEVNPKSGKRFLIRKMYTDSLGPKATARKDLESWRGKKMTEPERQKFDYEAVLGANCQLNIQHALGNNGQTYANVMNVLPAAGGVAPLVVEDYERREWPDLSADSAGPGGLVAQPPDDESLPTFDPSLASVPPDDSPRVTDEDIPF